MILTYDSVDIPCAEIIRRFQNSPSAVEQSRDLTSNYREGKSLRISGREDWLDINKQIHQVIGGVLDVYQEKMPFTDGDVEDTGYTVHEYLPGQIAKSHCDGGPQQLDIALGMVFFLNEVPAGELYFPRTNEWITSKANRVVVFPAHFAYPHVTLGAPENRYVLVTWVRYKNWRTTTGETACLL